MATAPTPKGYPAPQTSTDADAPRKPYVLGAWLAFDPDETLAQFFARKKDALAAGDQAWREGKIKAHHQKLYERLVDAVGAHQYSWVKVETLAVEFKADESTIKRWLTVLEKQAKLIRRQRQFKTSSRTYLVAYDQRQVQTASDDQAEHGASDEPAPQPTAPAAAAATVTDDHAPQLDAAPDAQAADAAPVFFECEDAPTYSAHVRPEVKNLPFNTSSDSGSSVGVNGGTYTFDIITIDPDIRAIIDDEVINSDHGRQVIAARPLDELRAVQSYLDTQTNVRDRSGLFVWLNERAFGAELLAGRTHTPKRQLERPAAQAPIQRRRRHAQVVEQEQHPARANEYEACCAACGERAVFLCNLNDPFCEHCGVRPGDELGKDDGLTPDPELWQAILARLDVVQTDRDVWLMPTMLAHYDDLLVLACPHKRVRRMIRMCYLDHICAVAIELLGRPVQVETMVTYMPDVTEEQRAAWLSAVEPEPCEAAWHADEPHSSVADMVLDHEQEQVVTVPPPTAAYPKPFTPSVQLPMEQDADRVSVHGQPHAEMVRKTHVSPHMPPIHEVWVRVQSEVAISLSERRIWLEPSYLLRIDQDCATVSAPNIFVRNRLATYYHDQLAATLTMIVGRPLRVEVVTESSGAGRRP